MFDVMMLKVISKWAANQLTWDLKQGVIEQVIITIHTNYLNYQGQVK